MKFEWKTGVRIGVCAFVLFLCMYYWDAVAGVFSLLLGAIAPLLIGFVIAYVLNILMSFYERHYFTRFADRAIVKKSRRGVCMTAAILTLCGIVALVIGLVVPELISAGRFLIAEIPPVLERLLTSDFVRRVLPADLLADLSSVNWGDYLSRFMQVIGSGLGNAVGTVVAVVSAVFSGIVTTFLSIVFAIYLLLARDRLRVQCRRLMRVYLRPAWSERVHHWFAVGNDCLHRYIVGQCTEAVILGALCTLGMLLFRFPYAAMIGALIGFTALIPVAGAYIGAAAGALMILTVSPVKALLFLVFIVVLQQLEGNLIYPKVVGSSIGLPALWVLAAVTVGGSLMGIPGMLLGVPLAATLYRLLREDVAKREQARLPKETES